MGITVTSSEPQNLNNTYIERAMAANNKHVSEPESKNDRVPERAKGYLSPKVHRKANIITE